MWQRRPGKNDSAPAVYIDSGFVEPAFLGSGSILAIPASLHLFLPQRLPTDA